MNKTVTVLYKPVSTNDLYVVVKGQPYKSAEYKAFSETVPLLLPTGIKIPRGKIVIHYEFGITTGFDSDNCVKAFQDIISKKYRFNDNRVAFHTVLKTFIRPSERYFMKFRIDRFDPRQWRKLTE